MCTKRLAAAIVLLTCSTGCTIYFDGSTAEVQYRVHGDAPSGAYVDYLDENGDTLTVSASNLPWSYSFMAEEGQPVFLRAEKRGKSGQLIAAIRANGRLVDAKHTNVAHGEVAAHGRVP